ncbi:hypothetical protein [Pedobacter endophyticus]|uniref:Uncharacterized protein n=1 Tax=Pedobacter endophyticus TaxID=2789740 RepID=A0A7S9Q0A8_9SPHI|nr:hypothetical protein [Pedobacter endophyticus]QPH41448.1 hypothetical protein IZT61_09395 [Pedobacter endophyticus]
MLSRDKTILFQKRLFFFVVVLSISIASSFAQQKVKDGTVSGGNLPNANAILELETSNKGLLLPRVELRATTQASPLSAFVNGMVVFNTATVADVSPAIYYCDGTRWIMLSTATTTTGEWRLTGNAGTNPATQYLGTSDNNPLIVKTNGAERMRVVQSGRVGIGTNSPNAVLDVQGDVIIGTLTAGDVAKDMVLVIDPLTGLVKKAPLTQSGITIYKSLEVIDDLRKETFNTPATITDINKLSFYRNGVSISFTQNSATSIVSEIPCVKGDEIRIVQIL